MEVVRRIYHVGCDGQVDLGYGDMQIGCDGVESWEVNVGGQWRDEGANGGGQNDELLLPWREDRVWFVTRTRRCFREGVVGFRIVGLFLFRLTTVDLFLAVTCRPVGSSVFANDSIVCVACPDTCAIVELGGRLLLMFGVVIGEMGVVALTAG